MRWRRTHGAAATAASIPYPASYCQRSAPHTSRDAVIPGLGLGVLHDLCCWHSVVRKLERPEMPAAYLGRPAKDAVLRFGGEQSGMWTRG